MNMLERREKYFADVFVATGHPGLEKQGHMKEPEIVPIALQGEAPKKRRYRVPAEVKDMVKRLWVRTRHIYDDDGRKVW